MMARSRIRIGFLTSLATAFAAALSGCQFDRPAASRSAAPDMSTCRVAGSQPSECAGVRRARLALERIAKTSAETRDSPDEYYFAALLESAREFWRLADGPQADCAIGWLVDQFGRHGPAVDFRLLFGECAVFLPLETDLIKWPWPDGDLKLDDDAVHRARLTVFRRQTEMFLRRPETLTRYTQAILWARFILPSDFYGLARVERLTKNSRQAMNSPNKDEYWWGARNFLLLACATDRLDLIKDLQPDKLQPAFEKWVAWFEELADKIGEMRAFFYVKPVWIGEPFIRPLTVPFSDWRGEPPPVRIMLVYSLHYHESLITEK